MLQATFAQIREFQSLRRTIGSEAMMPHWFLNLLVRRLDMPISPANFGHLPLLGMALWTHP